MLLPLVRRIPPPICLARALARMIKETQAFALFSYLVQDAQIKTIWQTSDLC